MSFDFDNKCTWYTRCTKYDCSTYGNCVNVLLHVGPFGNTHEIKTKYELDFNGHKIPLVKTTRNFGVSYQTIYGDAKDINYYYPPNSGVPVPFECTDRDATIQMCSVSEACTIEKSVLHYLNKKTNTCLYMYVKETVNFNISSSEMAEIKDVWGISRYHQVRIMKDDVDSTRTTEWRLLTDGELKILSTETVNIMPFTNDIVYESILFPGYVPDPNIVQILLFGQPPSLGIPWSPDIACMGFYDYGSSMYSESGLNRADGGHKDMFYPAWCRYLHEDPFWRKAADNRYAVDVEYARLTNDNSYIPPKPATDPIPRGNSAKHPTLDKVYQFLTGIDTHIVTTSPNYNPRIDDQLALAKNEDGSSKNLATHDTTLYYPIGVI